MIKRIRKYDIMLNSINWVQLKGQELIQLFCQNNKFKLFEKA